MSERRPTGIRLIVLVLASQVPMYLLLVVIIALTASTLETIESTSALLHEHLVEGTLSAQELAAFVRKVKWDWFFLLALQALLVTTSFLCGSWAYRRMDARLASISDYMDLRMQGEPATGMLAMDTGRVGRLEAKVAELADTIAEQNFVLEAEVRSQRFLAQLQRALELAETEAEVHTVAKVAAERALPGRAVELLLLDASMARLGCYARTREDASQGCPAGMAASCPSMRSGQPLAFPDSRDIDACPRLRDRNSEPLNALCSPVNVMGRAIGVLHMYAPVSEQPGEEHMRTLRTIATQTGTRLGMIRTLEATQLQARTDSLTGLLNRRSFEAIASKVLEVTDQAAVVMCDLDHFKRLNDTHGHDVGDRALRLFSQIVRNNLKRDDIVGRRGGEEFVIFLDACGSDEALTVVTRIREALHQTGEASTVPRFTSSFGVALFPTHGVTLDELIRRADMALYEAKNAGRDRAIVAGMSDDPAETGDSASITQISQNAAG